MTQEIKCPNILRYDREQEKYLYCDHVFVVDEANRGKVVQCPTCGNEVRLGSVDLSRTDVRLQDEAVDATPATSGDDLLDDLVSAFEPPAVAPAAKATEPVDESDVGDIFAEPIEASSQADDAELLDWPEPVQGPPLDDLQLDQPDPAASSNEDASAHLTPDDQQRLEAEEPPLPSSKDGTSLRMGSYCPSCSAALPSEEMLCTSCGYHKKLNRRIRSLNAEDGDDQPRGFQLWLQNSLTEGTSVQGILLLSSALLLGLLLVAAGVTYAIAGLCALVFLPPIVLVVVLLLSLAEGSGQSQQTGAGAWVRRLLWTALLHVLRLTGWQICSWPPGKTVVKSIHDAGFDDDQLLELEGLDAFDVLDLERSSITDTGAGYLTAFPQLKFVVVRKTHVSEEAVRRLQRAIPAAWIWH